MEKASLSSLRFRLFVTAGKRVHSQGRKTLRLAVPLGERDWRQIVFGKLHCPWPTPHSRKPACLALGRVREKTWPVAECRMLERKAGAFWTQPAG